ncbi:MAG: hypothetical protein QOF91_3847 [Alphaproteobacteria bacterium]|nr:hypothetical protein [Alphaproteobacteria bacterium]
MQNAALPEEEQAYSTFSGLAEQADIDPDVEIAPGAVAGHHRKAELGRKREAGAISKRYVAAFGFGGEESGRRGARPIEDLNGQIEGPDDILDVFAT